MRVGAIDHFTENQLGDNVNLLRPVTSSQTSWRWSPLFPDSDEVFELLDRKIPAQLFVLCQTIMIELPNLEKSTHFEKLLRAVSQISNTLPSSDLFSQVGYDTL